MTTYVIMNRGICGIDGSIQYIYNKTKFLEAKGFRVIVFSCKHGTILVDSLKKFERFVVPAFRYCPSMYTNRETEKILADCASIIVEDEPDEIIIESTYPVNAVWAELLAKRLNCKHVFFDLVERMDYDRHFRDFCKFKNKREELAGITAQTVKLLLRDDTVKSVEIAAYCNNVFDECPDRFSPMLNPEANNTIGSLGRLEKPCVKEIANALVRYCGKHPEKTYNVVFIGGDEKGRDAELIREAFSAGCQNVNLIITGYLYPIPNSLVDRIDVFVSTAGAASATYLYGKPTVKTHPITGKPLGIAGCDFNINSRSIYEPDESLTIEKCVSRVLDDCVDINYSESLGDAYQIKMNEEFHRQLQFAEKPGNKAYYDPKQLIKLRTPFIRHHEVLCMLGKCIGGKRLCSIVEAVEARR